MHLEFLMPSGTLKTTDLSYGGTVNVGYLERRKVSALSCYHIPPLTLHRYLHPHDAEEFRRGQTHIWLSECLFSAQRKC